MKCLLVLVVAAVRPGSGLRAPGLHGTLSDRLQEEFQAADTSGDGVIDQAEFAAMREGSREEGEAEGAAVVKFASHRPSKHWATLRGNRREGGTFREEEELRSYDSLSAAAPAAAVTVAGLYEEQQNQTAAIDRLQRGTDDVEDQVDELVKDVHNLTKELNQTLEEKENQALLGLPSPSHWIHWLLYWLLGFAIFACPTVVFAAVYRMLAPKTKSEYFETSGRWHNGLFDCFSNLGEDWPLCLMACFCPSVRWADTVSNEKHFNMLGFWPALLLFLLLSAFLAPVTAGISAVILLCYCVLLRRKLREVYGFEMGSTTLCLDVLSWAFCSCCTILQEARQVERVTPKTSLP